MSRNEKHSASGGHSIDKVRIHGHNELLAVYLFSVKVDSLVV